MEDTHAHVAVIGMSGRFPDAPDLSTFWQNLRVGHEAIHRMSDEQLRGVEYDFERIKDDPNYVRSRGILEGVDQFDAGFFGFSPREAAVLDPQQRIWLECAWEALEEAGCAPDKYPGLIGVYAGSYVNTYLLYNLCKDRDYLERLVRFRAVDAFQNIISNDKDYLPTRTSFKFDLKGPAVNVQTACSTSLVAVAQACSALASFEADVCIAGGVCVTLPQEKGYLYQEGSMNSPDGHCRPFDSRAQGTVFGSGVGAVVLKRLEEALRDGDSIRAVLRGWAVNNDGAGKVSYVAPSVEGQAAVIAQAHAAAGVEAESISYVEAHGTATPLGDPIEVAGLTRAFREQTEATGFCGLGSVKSNLGHLDAAAGITGLIKTILALENAELPANLHYESPNPEIDFGSSPFYVVDKLRPWQTAPGTPRRAGVSSFGVGGTNVHVVLEEAPAREPAAPRRTWQLLNLSARTAAALEQSCVRLADALGEVSDAELGDVAHTLHSGRKDFEERCFVVCRDSADGAALLRTPEGGRAGKGRAPDTDPSTVFMFPGQGTQHIDMCKEIYAEEPVFRDALDRCAEILEKSLGTDLRKVIFPTGDEAAREEATRILTQTSVTQPAMFMVEYALAQLWLSWGVQPAAMVGHSVGEYTAAVLAGVFYLEDGLRILAERARMMQDLPSGVMRAIRLSEAEVQQHLGDGVSLAAANAPKICVLTGDKDAMDRLTDRLNEAGQRLVCLHTSHAFHSEMMEPVMDPLAELVAQVPRQAPQIPILSTLTGDWLSEADALDPGYWARQLRQPVRFSAAVDKLMEAPGRVFLEVGPGTALSTSTLQHNKDGQRPVVVSSCGHATSEDSSMATLLAAAGRLWIQDLSLDWAQIEGDRRSRKLALPTYPFERQRYWVDPPPVGGAVSMSTPEPVLAIAGDPAAAAPAAAPVPAADRKERIATQIREIFYDLSGVKLEAEDDTRTFLEMGMDSLFLTQASAELGNQFEVPIKFRAMLEDVNSLAKLVTYFDERLPETAFAAAAPAPAPAPTAAPGALAMPQLPAAAAGAQGVEALIQQQLLVMQQQLAAVQAVVQGGTSAPAAAAAGPAAAGPAARNTAMVQATLEGADVQESKIPAKARFGPYAPVQRGEDGGLTEAQEAHLRELIARLCEKTSSSKAAADRSRDVLADPRSVSGFRSVWKELVYQIVAERSKGPRLWDVDGNEYVDITMGFGVNFLGHSPDFVVAAAEAQLRKGVHIGPQCDLAEQVARGVSRLTGLQRVSFCNTGSEAVMAAMRMARTVTGRSRVVYFSHDYHGVFDEVLGRSQVVRKQLQTLPAAPGILQDSVNSSMVLEYGSPRSLEILRACAGELAAVLVEPIQSRHPELRPAEFLAELRTITAEAGVALIFDEVITGFRVGTGGAQEYYGVQADLATYGKVIGGGMPIGVVAGEPKYMDALDGGPWSYGDDSAPEADMTFFAGTFVRHPLALAAAEAVVAHLEAEGPSLQADLNRRTALFADELNAWFERTRTPIRIRQFSSWFRFDLPQDLPFAALVGYHLLDRGIYFREPGQNCFFSTTHSDADIETVKQAVIGAVQELQAAGFLPGGEPDQQAEPVPLTEGQEEIWIACQGGDEASCAYNEGFHLDLRGPLDVPALQQAIRRAVGRHEALSLRFDSLDPLQRPGPVPTITLEVEDCVDDQAAAARAFTEEASRAFDLQDGPLVRFRLLHLGEDRHRLLGCAHHIVFDGWSCSVLVDEISRIYTGLVRAEVCELPAAESFLDYVREERERRAAAPGRDALAYWSGQFETTPPLLELPKARPHDKLRSGQADSLTWRFDDEVYRDFRAAIGKEGATTFAGLFAVFNILLHRLSGAEDLVVGIMVAGQSEAGADSLVGHGVNLLPVRSSLDPQQAFGAFLAETRKRLLDAQDHQDCSFGRILEELSLPRIPGRLPLMEVIFNLDRDVPGQGFEGLEVSIRENPKAASHFDLFLNLNEQDGGLEVKLDYLVAQYPEAQVRQWLEQLQALMQAVAAGTQVPVCDLGAPQGAPQLDEQWRRLNDTAGAYPSDSTLQALIEAQVDRSPEAPAIVLPGASPSSVSYTQLDQQANQIAAQLRASGCETGDVVAVCMERGAELVPALLGVMKAGAAYLPIDPTLPAERIQFMLTDSGASLVLSAGNAESLDAGDARVLDLRRQADAFAAQPTSRPDLDQSSASLAYLIYTSGSTGYPKGVAVPHRALVNFLTSMAQRPGIAAEDRLLAVTTMSFDISLLELFGPLIVGAQVVLAETEDVADGEALRTLLDTHSATLMQATPMTWRLLAESGWTAPPGFRALCGGEPLAADLAKDLLERGATLWNMYGPTETCIWSTCTQIRSAEQIDVGTPIANTQVLILDPQLRPVAPGQPGELCIGGDGLASGYHNREALTEDRFVRNPFAEEFNSARLYRTGDLARLTTTGTIEVLGRLDDQVKVHGYRIELGEIEARLRAVEGITDCAVSVAGDTATGAQLVAYCVTEAERLDAVMLRAALAVHLPEYMIPAFYVPMTSLPRTANNKLDRKALPPLERDRVVATDEIVAPRNEVEETLLELWRLTLNVQHIGVTTDFFDLGGHSLIAARMLTRAREAFGIDLSLRGFFAAPTIAGLATYVQAQQYSQAEEQAPGDDAREFEI